MNLKDIVIISGKPGIFKIISKTRDSIIVESMDEKKTKFRIQSSYRMSVLAEISIYTTNGEDIFLKDIYKDLYKKDGVDISITAKDSNEKLRTFFEELVPNHDKQRVYISDIKKLIKWYIILTKEAPHIFENLVKEDKEEDSEEVKKEQRK